MTFALDTTAIVFALDPDGRRVGEREHAQQVQDFLTHVRRVMGNVILPAPALSETLAFFADDISPARLQEIIRRGWRVVPTDAAAAAKAADLWRESGGREYLRRMKAEFDISKQCVKSDILIVATGIVHGAEEFIALDNGIRETCRVAGVPCRTPAECVFDPDRPARGTLFYGDDPLT